MMGCGGDIKGMPVAASEVAYFGLGAGCGYEDSRTLIGCLGQDGRRVRGARATT